MNLNWYKTVLTLHAALTAAVRDLDPDPALLEFAAALSTIEDYRQAMAGLDSLLVAFDAMGIGDDVRRQLNACCATLEATP